MKKRLYHIFYGLAGLLGICFVVFAVIDAIGMRTSSAPYSVYLLLRAIMFLLPALMLWLIGMKLRKKYAPKQKLDKEGKKRRRKHILIGVGVTISSVFVLITIGPPIALQIVVNRHCDYIGDDHHFLQDVYSADEFGLEEKVHTLSSENGNLWVSEIPCEHPSAVIIYVSGIMQPSVTYFYPHAKLMLEKNYASFLLEVNSHGRSDGNRLGLGYTEVEDVKAVIDYIYTEKTYENVPIILQGVSMGGAIVLNSFGEIPEVAGCIAMSPYASFENELDLLMQSYHIPKFLRSYELFFMKGALCLNYGKERVETRKPILEIQKAGDRPVSIIACQFDSSVPVQNTHALSSVAPNAMVWIRPSWEHFIVEGCNFVRVAEDNEYCDFIFARIEEIISSAKR